MFKSKYFFCFLILTFISAELFFQSCKQPVKEEEKSDSTAIKQSDLGKLNDEIVSNPGNSDLYAKRAVIFLQKNNLKQAYDDISKAVSIDSMNESYYLLLADISFKGLLIQQSINAFGKAILLKPDDLQAHLKYSELLLYLKAYEKCLLEADMALKIDKHTPKAYFIKGFAYKETGDTARALSSFQTSVELDPDYYDAYIQLGNIESKRMHPVALQYYNNALRIQPSRSF